MTPLDLDKTLLGAMPIDQPIMLPDAKAALARVGVDVLRVHGDVQAALCRLTAAGKVKGTALGWMRCLPPPPARVQPPRA